jgi:hypothetical protein
MESAFEKIKEYLFSPPVLRAPKIYRTFKLYVAAQLHVVGVVLRQEERGKEFPVAYISRCMLDVESQYIFVH